MFCAPQSSLMEGPDAGEADFEDADALELHLLTEFEEVLHRASEFIEHGLDVRFLD
jgi:hypothetical protein